MRLSPNHVHLLKSMGIVCATARCSNSQTSRTWGRRRFIGTASVSSDGIKTSGTPLSPMAAYRRPWNSGRVRLSSGHASHLSRSEPMLGAFEFQPAPLHYPTNPFKGFFSVLYLKKLKFQKYMAVSKNFKTIPPVAFWLGDRT